LSRVNRAVMVRQRSNSSFADWTEADHPPALTMWPNSARCG
jgi:hypothetical protein